MVDGYRFSAPLATTGSDFDAQSHLNNASIVRLFNDLRIAYVQAMLGSPWLEYLARERVTVVVRELHVLYESEGRPDERFVGAMRVAQRSGKTGVVEEMLLEVDTARPIARCWVVQLLVQNGRVIDWPGFYWDLVTAAEGHAIPERSPETRPAWGPPPAGR